MPFLATRVRSAWLVQEFAPVPVRARRHAGRQAAPEVGALALQDTAGHLYSHSESLFQAQTVWPALCPSPCSVEV